MLFADGDETYDLIVVLEGKVQIIEHFGKPEKADCNRDLRVPAVPGRDRVVTGQRVYVTAAVSEAGRVLRVPADSVQVIIGTGA